jgi:hypothetical protein
MTDQATLDVVLPRNLASIRLMNRQFRTHVRRLMRQSGGEDITGASDDDDDLFSLCGTFPHRDAAVESVMSIRTFSLEHAKKSAKNFSYTIDTDEMLLFKNKGDLYAYESKSFHEAVVEALGHKLFESFGGAKMY